MPKLTQKKSVQISKKLQKSRDFNSKKWSKYRDKKRRILSYKTISKEEKKRRLESERVVVRSNISHQWETYRNYKYSIKFESPFVGLKFDKRIRTRFTKQEFYTVSNKTNIEESMQSIFDNPKVRYILVIMTIKLVEGTIIHVSDSFTKDAFELLQEEGIIEKVLEKLSFVHRYEGFELISTHFRVIYENTKKNK